jgi:hypothetical protein
LRGNIFKSVTKKIRYSSWLRRFTTIQKSSRKIVGYANGTLWMEHCDEILVVVRFEAAADVYLLAVFFGAHKAVRAALEFRLAVQDGGEKGIAPMLVLIVHHKIAFLLVTGDIENAMLAIDLFIVVWLF